MACVPLPRAARHLARVVRPTPHLHSTLRPFYPLLARYASTKPAKKEVTAQADTTETTTKPSQEYAESKEPITIPKPPPNFLSRYLSRSPRALALFKKLVNRNPKQSAGRRAFVLYEHLCVLRADEEAEFWRNHCHLPPTFQSWFIITNLHVWLLTVRFRALPLPHGKLYEQALIDHFFLDIEDRIRAVLQPVSKIVPSHLALPYTAKSIFYDNPNVRFQVDPETGKEKRIVKGRAPDRIFKRQMLIFREQWQGMGMSLDIGLVNSDMELAAAIWRNLLGARGAQGFELPQPNAPTDPSSQPKFTRRAVNLVGGTVVNVGKVDFEKEALKDDGSGVFDFPASESDQYVAFPELMHELVEYVRSEVTRMAKIPDEHYMEYGKIRPELYFRKVRP